MSWNGTMRCSYCYGQGHSKRKCPTMKERHDQYVALTEAGEATTYRQRSAHREWKEMQETLKESNKVCGYCQNSGHRVTTCPLRLEHVSQLRKVNKWWKPLVAKVFKETGFGLGALTQRSVWAIRDGEDQRVMVPHVILGIEDHAVDFCNLSEGFGCITVMNTETMRRDRVRLPPDVAFALFKAAIDVEGFAMPENQWCDTWRNHPLTSGFTIHRPPSGNDGCIMGPSEKTFHNHDRLFFPLEKKADINKMFRAKDKGRTKEFTGAWVADVVPLLKKHKGVKL